MSEPIELDHFPIRTYEKLRYADTDRQGHVNNAVFATMFETGRVEILYDPNVPLASPNCAFVIVNLGVDFRSEISWPGRVWKAGSSDAPKKAPAASCGREGPLTLEIGAYPRARRGATKRAETAPW